MTDASNLPPIPSAPPVAARQRVLIIDDSPMIHALVKARLVEEPIDIRSASSAAEGLSINSEWPADLILLDVDMPDVDGFETCRRLKSDPATMQIPIVFLTGAASTEQKIQGLELGAADYVTKPFDPAELRARVRATLRTKYLLDLLSRKAQIDGLTGMWNRNHFNERLSEEMGRSRRTGSPMSVVMCDVDRFKSVNDTYGHPFGDDVLRAVAAALQACCRTEDVICRYGGEEFAIVATQAGSCGAAVLADRAKKMVAAVVLNHRAAVVSVTCSFGVAEFVSVDTGFDTVARADAALYQAKREGRDRVVIAGDTQERIPSAA